jgi:chemotaxis protein methyltransferase CheR
MIAAAPSSASGLSSSGFAIIAGLLKARSGLALGADKGYLLEARLTPIVRRLGLSGLDALCERIGRGDEALAREVVEAMTTNESLFFRDDKPFAHVRSEALPRLHAARPPAVPLRLWSAAASTGQEAYSLAMIVEELAPRLAGRKVEIIGTDIAREQLKRAREGVFTQFEVQRGLPMQMLVKHFRKEDCGWRIAERLRTMITFREWNLLADVRPLGQFDIVFCRNVLIYFDQQTKSQVLAAVARQMAADGLLYLGGAETVLGLSDRFVSVPGQRGVYALVAAEAAAFAAA